MRLAAVVVEQHTRRTVHLRYDHTLGAVDDEGAIAGHERHVAHVDILLLDIEDRAGLGFLVDLEHDQAQRDLHRRGIGDPALAAFDDVVFRRFEFVMDEVEFGSTGEVADRKHRAQRLLEAGDVIDLLVRTQELLVALALHLDEVRHIDDFMDVAEDLADPAFRRALRICSACLLGGLRGSFRLGSHKGYVPLLVCAGPVRGRPVIASHAREIHGRDAKRPQRMAHRLRWLLQLLERRDYGNAASILCPIPAHESDSLEACGRSSM